LRHWKRWPVKCRLSHRESVAFRKWSRMVKRDSLSEVGDVEKMAADAARLLSDTTLRREMGKRARSRRWRVYRTDIVIPQYIEFYERGFEKDT